MTGAAPHKGKPPESKEEHLRTEQGSERERVTAARLRELALVAHDGPLAEGLDDAADRIEELEETLRVRTEALRDLLAWAERFHGGDPSLSSEEWYVVRDYARIVLREAEGAARHSLEASPRESPTDPATQQKSASHQKPEERGT